MYCGRIWPSMGIAEDNAYSLAISPVYCYHNRLLLPNLQIYCRRRYLSTDTFHSQSIVASNVRGLVFPLVHCGSNIWLYTIVGSIVGVHVWSVRLLFPPPTRIFPILGCEAGCAIRNSQRGDNSGQICFFRVLFIHCHRFTAYFQFGSPGWAHFFQHSCLGGFGPLTSFARRKPTRFNKQVGTEVSKRNCFGGYSTFVEVR